MKKGFTLVEIMIVVAIIGIIIAIAVPAFLRARENSRGRACQENLTKIDGAKEQYILEKKESNAYDFGSDWDEIVSSGGTGYLKTAPDCPAGGVYTIGTGGVVPQCSYSAETWAVKHDLSSLND